MCLIFCNGMLLFPFFIDLLKVKMFKKLTTKVLIFDIFLSLTDYRFQFEGTMYLGTLEPQLPSSRLYIVRKS